MEENLNVLHISWKWHCPNKILAANPINHKMARALNSKLCCILTTRTEKNLVFS